MSTDKVMSVVSALVESTVVSTIEELAKFLSTKLDFDEDMVQFFEEFKSVRLSSLKEEVKQSKKTSKRSVKSTEEKAPRKKSVYNVFIKERVAELKSLPADELQERLSVLFESKPELKGKAIGKQLLALASSEYSKSGVKMSVVDVVETDEEVVEAPAVNVDSSSGESSGVKAESKEKGKGKKSKV